MSAEVQPERVLIRKLRKSAWMSGIELADRADITESACLHFETRKGPLTPTERRNMVAMLEVLLTCRHNYALSIRRWVDANKYTSAQAAALLGVSKHTLWKLAGERGHYPRSRDRIDQVLTDWERSLEQEHQKAA